MLYPSLIVSKKKYSTFFVLLLGLFPSSSFNFTEPAVLRAFPWSTLWKFSFSYLWYFCRSDFSHFHLSIFASTYPCDIQKLVLQGKFHKVILLHLKIWWNHFDPIFALLHNFAHYFLVQLRRPTALILKIIYYSCEANQTNILLNFENSSKAPRVSNYKISFLEFKHFWLTSFPGVI